MTLTIKSLYDAMPPELQRKTSLHTLRLTVEKYNATPNPLREAARYAMQRMETIRETNPEIALDDDIERVRRALDSENAGGMARELAAQKPESTTDLNG